MKPDEWWKNFALGLEVDASGAFIYNGIRALEELETLNHPVDIFEILYGLSVGVERLIKVAIILKEHDQVTDVEEFEKSLISHNTIDLFDRLDASVNQSLPKMHREFLALLSKFYKTHRYGRYSLGVVPNIQQERTAFLQFIEKHLELSFPEEDELFGIPNTDQIRKFIGKLVKKICDGVFSQVREEAYRLNIYTYEIRYDSKALKVFLGKDLDFISERIVKKELILFLMDKDVEGAHIDLLRSFEALDFDPNSVPCYIKALLNDGAVPYVEEEVDVLYSEIDNVSERLEFLSIMEDENLSFGNEDDE